MELLLGSMGLSLAPPVEAQFESESTLEVALRRTSFDFHLSSAQGQQVFVEVKYTEDGFGAAKNDEEHQRKFEETYVPLIKHAACLTQGCDDRAFFLRNYQILRNLVHITERSDVIFLFPRSNSKVARQAAHARDSLLLESMRHRLHIVFLEDIVAYLTDQCGNGNLGSYYRAFQDKYLGFAH